MAHECIQEENIGKFKEFMENTKGFKATLFAIALAILLQVGTFLFLWGDLTRTVKINTEQIWSKLTPTAEANKTNIEKILTRLDSIKIVGYAIAGENDSQKK
jgi:hypothetical protein